MERSETIAILLATYNGEKYISEQINSIIAQSYSKWHLYIRDDGSTDNTLRIIEGFRKQDNRISIISDDEKHIGPCRSFLKLLKEVDSPLYMFCDQDDVWHNNKIELSYNEYMSLADKYKNKPIIVHTDVTVVDEDLITITESDWDDIHLRPEKLKGYSYIAQCCYVQGNTMLFNNKVKDFIYPVADYAIMHDWWIATRVSRCDGIIKPLHVPTLDYRQHSSNVFGFEVGKAAKLQSRIKHLGDVWKKNRELYAVLKKDHYGSIFKYLWVKAKIWYTRIF